jgi:hypothetical protein
MNNITPLMCGRELAIEIELGLIEETDLTESGRANLQLWRESAEFRVSCLSDFDINAELMVRSHGDAFPAMAQYSTEYLKAEQEYRAENRKPSVTELLLEDE